MTNQAAHSDTGQSDPSTFRQHARSIWDAAVAAVRPQDLVRAALSDPSSPLLSELERARRILVIGGGKAGTAMAQGVEEALSDRLDRVEGWINVPEETRSAELGARSGKKFRAPSSALRVHIARPAGTNQPTEEGVLGARRILELVMNAGPDDICLCLLSGGGSALLPAPAGGLTLEDKQQLTRTLHACGATINEMNCVRKHLSAIKGGRLAQAFTGRALYSLIISDVIGDPLDVIASGPTAADPTTFADSLAVLKKYDLLAQAPLPVRQHLERGEAGEIAETLKVLPGNVNNLVIGNNALALKAAEARASALGYRVINLGSFIEGETREVAVALAGIVRSIRTDGKPVSPPVCLLSGGETTVTLCANHGLGGRNQEFVLAAALKLGEAGLRDAVILCGGTDGEDGPTDAAGASADSDTLLRARALGLNAEDFLSRNDAYHFFEATGDLLKTGLTQTNVMDVRVVLVG